MSGATTRSDGGGPAAPILALRRGLHEYGGPRGRALSETLTSAVDEGLLAAAAALEGRGSALVALGGYGRRELGPYSDVDVMVVYARRKPEAEIKRLLYPLWDAGISVGHSARTVSDVLSMAEARLENLTALLDRRFLLGDRALYDDMDHRLERWLAKNGRRVVRELQVREHQRWLRERYPLQEPDLKEGRGSLRAAQGLRWAASLSGEPVPAGLEPAYEALLAARNAVHVAAGKPEKRLLAPYWRRAGRWLGEGETWPRSALRAVRRVDNAATRYWSAGGPKGLQVRRPLRGPAAAMGLAEVVSTLQGGEEMRRAADELAGAGEGDAFLEGYQAAWCLPQLPEYHQHPLDVHLWRTVDELLTITSEEGPEPFAAEVAAHLPSLDAAVLAAFLHDIGKLDGAEHESAGAARAERLLERLSVPPADRRLITTCVREHLLLARTAMTRDTSDPDVIDAVAERVDDLDTLRVLYLLAVADSRASSPSQWSPWKSRLIRELTERVAGRLESSGAAEGGDGERADLEALVAAGGGRYGAAVIRQAILDGMPASYSRTFGPALRIAHLDLMTPPPGEHEVRLAVVRGEVDEVTLAARDRPGLLALTAGALTANGVTALSARIFTRDDGVALQVLHARDALGRDVRDERYAAARDDIAHALLDGDGLALRIARKIRDYRSAGGPWNPPSLQLRQDVSARYTVVEVQAPDRVGLLYVITSTLRDCGLDIHLAKVTTSGDEAFDVFYVTLQSGEKVLDERLAGEVVGQLHARLSALAKGDLLT